MITVSIETTRTGAEQILALCAIFLSIAFGVTIVAIVKQEIPLAVIFGITTVGIAAITRAAFRMMKSIKRES